MTTLAAPETTRMLILVGVVIAVLFVATVAIMVVRKKVLGNDHTPASGLLMDDFRRLHASGQLSDTEFQALRNRMAAKMKASLPGKGSLHEEPPGPARTARAPRAQRPLRPPSSE